MKPTESRQTQSRSSASTSTELTLRQQGILRALVEDYITTAEPVASETLTRKYSMGISSATVRSTLATLEDGGYIHQPHASAGRIPTDLGYRYYVEYLLEELNISVEEQRMIRHQFYQVQMQVDQWVRLAAAVLVQAVPTVAVVSAPRAPESRIKHFELVAIRATLALLVLVLHDGTIKQEMIHLDVPASQEDLQRISERLNNYVQGLTYVQMHSQAVGLRLNENERLTLRSLEHIMRDLSEGVTGPIYHEGLLHILNQPEYRLGPERERSERVQHMLEILEHNRFLSAIAPQVLAADGVQVIIGAENQLKQMGDTSVVISRYGVPGKVSGLLGLIGPTRMPYARAIAIVRYMSSVMNDLLSGFYGE